MTMMMQEAIGEMTVIETQNLERCLELQEMESVLESLSKIRFWRESKPGAMMISLISQDHLEEYFPMIEKMIEMVETMTETM